ncbi:MAG: hypothetical protein E7476_05065 [Ruminococcaceae bacterium]|nr:hypothetical protein [Oscillospiraceae bacterium]
MEISVAEQTWMFLASVALGAALGVCYDVFRILRIAIPHRTVAVVAEDILFFALCAAATFCFLLAAGDGQLRAFIIIGEAVGGILYYCTIGVLIIGIARWIIAAIKWVFHMIWKIFIRPVWSMAKKIAGFFSKKLGNTANCIKSKVKNSNSHLKNHSQILYNLKSNIMRTKKKTGDGNSRKKRSEK